MRLVSAGRPHLTYSANVHPGESWPEVQANLERHVLAVKRRVAPDVAFGVGLRLSARAAEELSAPGELDALKAFLDEHRLYVFTINGFPHGAFHGEAVKESVYLPDWLDPARLAYTDRLARILAEILPDEPDLEGTVSTVPGAFKPRVRTLDDCDVMAEHLVRHVATLHRLRERTGKTLSLAIEPEPCCHLETVRETISFFEEHLFSRRAMAHLTALTGLGVAAREAALRRHLGVCFDACHMAVEYEGVAGALAAFDRAGIRIGKIQLSAGLQLALGPGQRDALAALHRFAEGVYLHQAVERRGDRLTRHRDLPEALGAAEAKPDEEGELRVHFHVPVFQKELGPLRSTQAYLRELLAILRRRHVSSHLEIETYTWEVLPEEHRRGAVDEAIARELAWVRALLESDGGAVGEPGP